MELTGLQNPVVKAAAELKQKKYRTQNGLYLAEGLRTAEEAVAYKAVETLFYVATDDDRTMRLLEDAAMQNIKLVCVNENVMKKIADTETPQGIIAVCKMRQPKLETLLAGGKMLLVLDRVGDPGNIGTMLRTADAAGIGGLVLLKGCADIYAPKTVRSSMGSLFHIPVLSGVSEQEFVSAAKKAGYIPPSGVIMGIYARTDNYRGVHKAPANEVVYCTGLKTNYTKGEQDVLNPEGINLIRNLPGQAFCTRQLLIRYCSNSL